MNNGLLSAFTPIHHGTRPSLGGQASGYRGRLNGDDVRIMAWPAADKNNLGTTPARYVNTNNSLGSGRYTSAILPDDRGFIVNVLSGTWLLGNGVPFAAGMVNIGGNVIYGEGMTNGISGFTGATVTTNYPGRAMNYYPMGTGFADNGLLVADGAACTVLVAGVSTRTAFRSNFAYAVANAGTIAVTNDQSFHASIAVGAGVTVTNAIGFRADDGNNGGTITNQYGFYTPVLTGGVTNYPISVMAASTPTITVNDSLGPGVSVGTGSTLTMNVATPALGGAVTYNPTYTLQQTGSSLAMEGGLGGGVFVNSATYQTSTAGVDFGPVVSFISAYTKTIDTATGRAFRADIGFSSQPTFSATNSGTFTSGGYTAFSSKPTVNGTGCTLTTSTDYNSQCTVTAGTVATRKGVFYQDATGAGAVTNQFAIDIAALSKAGTSNVGIRCAPALVYPPTVCTCTSNAATVTVNLAHAQVTNSSAATCTITLNTTGALDGQELLVRFFDATAASQTVTFTNSETGKAGAPPTSFGSTSIPTTYRFIYNSGTTKWTYTGN